jgi:hypothetical protein
VLRLCQYFDFVWSDIRMDKVRPVNFGLYDELDMCRPPYGYR